MIGRRLERITRLRVKQKSPFVFDWHYSYTFRTSWRKPNNRRLHYLLTQSTGFILDTAGRQARWTDWWTNYSASVWRIDCKSIRSIDCKCNSLFSAIVRFPVEPQYGFLALLMAKPRCRGGSPIVRIPGRTRAVESVERHFVTSC